MARKKKQVISKEHLEKTQNTAKQINDTTLGIGRLEIEKTRLLSYLEELNQTMENLKKELEQEYGDVTIDLNTGEYKSNENGTDTKD